jgi:glycerol-3-phosphate dehydrogenase (NAD(P)+)
MLPHLRPEMLFVSATKGIEDESLLRMTEVITEVLRDRPGASTSEVALYKS